MRRLACALLVVAATLAAEPAARACSCPQITRDKIISIAKSGVGSRYIWGGTCWDPSNRRTKGADCSGYVTKCWQIPKASAVTTCVPHYYTTSTFLNQRSHWSSISRSSLQRGDSLVYNSGGSGHIILFEAKTSTSGCYKEYEARGSAYGIMHRVKCVGSSYQARRRHNIVNPPPPPPPNLPPKGYLDAATCQSLQGWAQDPNIKTTAISVRIYVDSVPGQTGAVSYLAKADQNRSDLVASLGSANHGFVWATPAKLKDGKTHTLHVYALDSAGGQNPELTGSPKKITCAPPAGGEAGPDPTPDPDDHGDAGPGDELPSDEDGGTGADPAPVFENPVEVDDDEPDTAVGGCGCRTGGGAERNGLPLALVIAAMGVVLRRRRRAR